MTNQLETSIDTQKRDSILSTIKEAMGVEFSEEQLNAITFFRKPLVVDSCAGSGKTTTVVATLLFRELYYGISPVEMIAITFNKDASEELSSRYFKSRAKIPELNQVLKVTFKTYHALFYLILKSKHSTCTWENISEYYKYAEPLNAIIRKTVTNYSDDTLETIMSLRGYQINELLSLEDLKRTEKFITHSMDAEAYEAVINEYERLKKEDNAIDFDDLQLLMLEEIKKNPAILTIIHSAWKHFIVDEYQDVSKVQLEILKHFIANYNNLTVYGDCDQAIYEFRGSRPEYIVDFPMHFQGAVCLQLGTNYRVPSNILTPIITSIEQNKIRLPKNMRAHNTGGILEFTPTAGAHDTALKFADIISEFHTKGIPLDDIVILIRNNFQQRLIIDALLRKNIPVSTRSKFSLERQMIVQDYKAIMELAQDPKNRDAFKRIAHKIFPYMKAKNVESIVKDMRERGIEWRENVLNSRTAKYNRRYFEVSDILAELQSSLAAGQKYEELKHLVDSLYQVYFERLMSYQKNSSFFEVKSYIDMMATGAPMPKFFADLAYYENLHKYYLSNNEGTVTVSTIHRMKGLEYPYVFLLDLTEETLPNASIEEEILESTKTASLVENYIEQERRLFYGTKRLPEIA